MGLVGACATACAFTFAFVGVFFGILSTVIAFVLAAVLCVCLILLTTTEAFADALAFTGAIPIALTAFFCWIGWLTLKQEDRDPWLRQIVIAFAAIGGTSFYQANLTRTDFTVARLKSTNFNQAQLNKTIFHNAVKLELARPGKTVLANWRVREFLINPSTGEDQNFRKADLRGANLDNANLQNADLTLADLSQASLVNANLKRANLTEVNAVQSDFRHATLTAACVENWNIDQTTNLENVDCQHVYLLNGEQERRPNSGEFAAGEFTKLFQEVFGTVVLIFRKGMDWRAFLATLETVQAQNPETPLSMEAIEDKGDGVFVAKVKVPPEADKEKLHAELTATYEQKLLLQEAQYKAELAQTTSDFQQQLQVKDQEIIALYRQQNASLDGIVHQLAERPITIAVNQTNQDKSQRIDVGQNLEINADESTINLRDMKT